MINFKIFYEGFKLEIRLMFLFQFLIFILLDQEGDFNKVGGQDVIFEIKDFNK